MAAKKKPDAVLAAEAKEREAHEALAAAREALGNAENNYHAAVLVTREARFVADAEFPQCRLVSIGWRNDRETEVGRVVIVRQTPTGMLVTRRVGDDVEQRFKFSKYRGVYVDARKSGGYLSTRFELRDIPNEWMPPHPQE